MAGQQTAGNTAAPSVAGCFFQLERALVHLAEPSTDAVAVEHFDDVTRFPIHGDREQEQDKHTLSRRRMSIGDRHPALWRTLQIWVGQRRQGEVCGRYLIAANQPVHGPIVDIIKRIPTGNATPGDVVAALRAASQTKLRGRNAVLQPRIDDVLLETDEQLASLVAAISIVDGPHATDWRTAVARGFAIDPDIDHGPVLSGLFGWLAETLLEAWRLQKAGIVSRTAASRQCRRLEQASRRQRLLPRPASEVHVSPEERSNALSRRFVHHLTLIDAASDDVVQAVDHFLQFGIEKYRIGREGSVPVDEWRHRGERLRVRWSNIVRQTKLQLPGSDSRLLGNEVLMRTTYAHDEPLAGSPCGELYMTSGHYHRLAEIDEVWWDPTFVPKVGDEV